MKVKKGDNVIVLTGKDKGKRAKVLKAVPLEGRVVIEGVNLRKKRQKPRKSGEKGQVLDKAHPLSVSNVAIWCASCSKGVRVGSLLKGGKNLRVCKSCGKEI